MAVQAQYLSNLLFHDRGEPERKEMDMPRPPQLAGVSPAAVYFSTGGASGNRRKRLREPMAPPPAAAKEEYVNLFTLQPQQSTSFVNMAHFQNQNRVSSSPSPAATALVSTGLRLAFDEQQQKQQQQQESKQMMNVLRHSSSQSLFASVSNELAAQVKQHDDEIDRFIREQGEQLRRAMADRLRRHNRAILVKADQSAARRLREKAAEAEREARRGAELEERLARLRGEAAAWQAKALSEQAAAVTLHAQLQQAAAAARASVEELAAAGDAGPAESSSSAYVDPRCAGPSSDRACLGCRLRPASVVLLPCRHLSLCGECFAAGDADAAMACPVCLCVRTGSVEAILC
ncbi:BOI-related E3 ubiquitin-protein ligase 1-like [Panicum miliaceum]|uniref:BOI-related E3 ubiquitin-protein ligase 1-like n=1 Tax=Panicum miliaceum TaxID=4540 RepID=A0A3L6RUJ6_PANMI|nr:BOI-related E3 ubiquitin-protein ligase 1-like [Panicum miliaceum]